MKSCLEFVIKRVRKDLSFNLFTVGFDYVLQFQDLWGFVSGFL